MEPGGSMKLNPYCSLRYVVQPAISVPVGVGLGVALDVALAVGVAVAGCVGVGVSVADCVGVDVGVGVSAGPTTLISTHQDFAASVPMPKRTPLAFWNLQ